ncbi:N-acetylmuramic acid 6-phosphate etherase [Cryobacterium mannosilyticum]|uniref:N-acetylmuramic acid 6-phosphate etherase n=1 Tax=Cryobacterium mannosilyticum TaxID=1259190 RepID=A0A4R8WF74_9MICO|nr:N-acetylmuramic acid 6-phosphate etherase [Cryobacterium mannosilyticum]TFC06360.1 N-acetylmuramic acid 6-phosphate etherase [Cryobacterium mannosilyticum]
MALASLGTETANDRTTDLDTMSVADLLTVMNQEDRTVPVAVAAALPAIENAVDAIVRARRRGGRLIYLGAGTSGRLGVLDAVECPPTFGTDPGEVLGLIAGGERAFLRAVEGAEDDPDLAVTDLRAVGLTDVDVVVGIAASGRTPYVIGGLDHARSVGAATVSIACNLGAEISGHADVAIEVDTGPEVLTGSTRLKAGSAQKLVCNMLSTASMIRTGKVFHNLMVDVQPTNAKLVDRARRIVSDATGVDPDTAATAIDQAGGHAKTAVVMLLTDTDFATATARLARAQGDVRAAITSP